MSTAKPWDITDAIDDAIGSLEDAQALCYLLSGYYDRREGVRHPALVDLAARLDRIAGELRGVVTDEVHELVGRALVAQLDADEATAREGRTDDR